MELVNPIGRSLDDGAMAITPRACFCDLDSWDLFDRFYGPGTDTCDHCGCGCVNFSTKTATSKADSANRKSYPTYD